MSTAPLDLDDPAVVADPSPGFARAPSGRAGAVADEGLASGGRSHAEVNARARVELQARFGALLDRTSAA